ncbi:NUDIX domain-containing protein [Angustibacter peucedani]
MFEKVGWVCVRVGRMLVGRNEGRDLFYLPGGRREDGETQLDTLVRELREELAVDVRPATARHLVTIESHRHESDEPLRMVCFGAEVDGAPTPSAEVVELAWVGPDDGSRVTGTERLLMAWLVEQGRLPGNRAAQDGVPPA